MEISSDLPHHPQHQYNHSHDEETTKATDLVVSKGHGLPQWLLVPF